MQKPAQYLLIIFILSFFALLLPDKPVVFAQSALSITNISDNKSNFPNAKIPKYEKLEITFNISGTAAKNFLYPYKPSPPPGISANEGITVEGIFTSPDGKQFTQPGFYYQKFEDQVKNNSEWFYPTNDYSWKLRFSPDKEGTWSYKIKAEDANGLKETSNISFDVVSSSKHGIVRVSEKDVRYFEHLDGTYFPGLGFNLNAGNLDITNPVLGNTEEFNSMFTNGIQLSRVWISQKSIYGSAWGAWMSPNPAFIKNEAVMGLSHKNDDQLKKYPGLVPPVPPTGSDFYIWLNFDETISGDGQYRLNACRLAAWTQPPLPLKAGKKYRIRVRYNTQNLIPADSTKPSGLVVKYGNLGSWGTTSRCYTTGVGTVIAATYPASAGQNWSNFQENANDPTWRILEGTYTAGADQHFIPQHLGMALENVKDPTGTDPDGITYTSGGHAFIEHVWLQEDLGSGSYGPNIIYKPDMDHINYINERNAYALDKILDFAAQKDVYLKMVMLDKNDYEFQSINLDGSLAGTKSGTNFYSQGRNRNTKVRFLQEAWWRYMQARWGYSQNVHSWELLNEGPDGSTEHWMMADEFGKFMRCYVFGAPVSLVNGKSNCSYKHPNWHPTTTSFYAGSLPYFFWKNTSGDYPNLDYVDVHNYNSIADDGEALFNDAAAFHDNLDSQRGAYPIDDLGNLNSIGFSKPIINAETGWKFVPITITPTPTIPPGYPLNSDPFEANVTDGLWLHNLIWAHIQKGGLLQQYWIGGEYQKHVYEISPAFKHDHRPKFKTYYDFIKNVPLNNGYYKPVNANATNSNLRVWGQKDTINNRAHIWVQNKNHTWKNIAEGIIISPITSNVTINGFGASQVLKVEKWNTVTGVVESTQNFTTSASGDLVLTVNNLTSDTAFKIGNYSQTISSPTPSIQPTLLGDINGDKTVNIQDYTLLSNAFGTTNPDSDLDDNGIVNIQDYTILSNNFGKSS